MNNTTSASASSPATLYLRSSKDKRDVSIEHQRKTLTDLAAARGLVVVSEYVDSVESGKDEDRPGFQALLRAIRARQRDFTDVLALDTSRIARAIHVAALFQYECDKRGITVGYNSLPPNMEDSSRRLLVGVMQSMDAMHSEVSREKGLAGMEENISRGFRAGGRAPRGYDLEPVRTGVMRDDGEIVKSRLRINLEAPAVQVYLRERVKGVIRKRALEVSGLEMSPASSVNLEWMALTYAGFNVWRVHKEKKRAEGTRRRPRSEWVIKPGQHGALITEEEAMVLINRLEAKQVGKSLSKSKRELSSYLLTEMLMAPDGRRWRGSLDRGIQKYKLEPSKPLKGRTINAALVDDKILDLVFNTICRYDFAVGLQSEMAYLKPDIDLKKLKTRQLATAKIEVDKIIDDMILADNTTPIWRALSVRLADAAERKEAIEAELDHLHHMNKQRIRAASVGVDRMHEMLKSISKRAGELPRGEVKFFLSTIVYRIDLCPITLDITVNFKIDGRDLGLASPRTCETYASVKFSHEMRLVA